LKKKETETRLSAREDPESETKQTEAAIQDTETIKEKETRDRN